MMPEVQFVTGEVVAISPKPDKDTYGIALTDADKSENWYNGKPDVPSGIEKGKTVEIQYDVIPQSDRADLKLIEDIKVVESKESGPTDSSPEKEKEAEPSGEGSGSTTYTNPNKYDIGMCFKDALSKASPHKEKEEYIEQVVKFTNWNLEARQRVKDQ